MSESSSIDDSPTVPEYLVEAVARLVSVYEELKRDLGFEPEFDEVMEAMYPPVQTRLLCRVTFNPSRGRFRSS